MIIYKITNTVTNKVYIGKTVKSLDERWKRHCTKMSACMLLHKSIKKYGKDLFVAEVIKTCNSLEELSLAEKEAIKTYNSIVPHGYNLTFGGDGGGVPSEIVKAKISKALKGFKKGPQSKEHIAKLSKIRTGKASKFKKPIKCSNGNTYSSAYEAAEILGLPQGNICRVLNGSRLSCGGYTFGYI